MGIYSKMTDSDKIQEEFERWWINYADWLSVGKEATAKDAFFAGYIRGQREAYMQIIADGAQEQWDYD